MKNINNKDKEQVIRFYFDDAGVFNKNSNDNVFVYAGFYFLDDSDLLKTHNKFLYMENKLRKSFYIYKNLKELKASKIKFEHKEKIFNIVDSSSVILVATFIKDINNQILEEKSSIGRFKDFMIKRLIRTTLEKLVIENKLDINKKLNIRLNLDQQTTKSNGYYSLEKLIAEDLKGTSNPEYNDTLFFDVDINLKYWNSAFKPIIRASDLIANLSYNYLNYLQKTKINNILNQTYNLIFVPQNQIKKIKNITNY